MPSAAQGHCSTCVEPTAISLGLINLFQHHIHHPGHDIEAEELAHMPTQGVWWGIGGQPAPCSLHSPSGLENEGGPERLNC